jgi:hypothetical protein
MSNADEVRTGTESPFALLLLLGVTLRGAALREDARFLSHLRWVVIFVKCDGQAATGSALGVTSGTGMNASEQGQHSVRRSGAERG